MQRRAGEALMKLIGDGLASIRGGRALFSGLSFSVAAGDTLLLMGPNGAGKTTLIRIIAGLIAPTAGDVRLEGGAAGRDAGEQCHYVGHLNAIKPSLTVEENAAFWCRFFGGTPDRVPAALATFGLAGLGDIPAAYLSAGQKRRLGLARVLLADRPIWLLDEPTVSLDREAQDTLTRVVEAHVTGGGLVLAATHAPLGFASSRALHLGAAATAA
jgi:heme exporter protein A